MVGVESVLENTKPWSHPTVSPPLEVTFPFPVACVARIPVAALVVTDGADLPAIKYLGISKLFALNHQQR